MALSGRGLTFGADSSAYAQGGAQQGQPSQQQGGQAAADVGDASLNKFKDAFAEVNSIRKSFAGKLENVEDPQKAQKNMVSAVEDAGLSVQEYNQIFAAVQQNPELQKKLLGDQ